MTISYNFVIDQRTNPATNPSYVAGRYLVYLDSVSDKVGLIDREFLGDFATFEEAKACMDKQPCPDARDSFHGSRSIKDREPTDADIFAFVDLAKAYYGKHPSDLSTEICDRLVREVLYGEQFLDEEQEEYRDQNPSMVVWTGIYDREVYLSEKPTPKND
jgi:hypothetical protein